MKVSIIILTFNSAKYIDELLGALISQYAQELKDKQLEIIIADNDSKDDTVKRAKEFKGIKVIENGGNVGFAKGNNLAARNAQGDILLFLNPDTKIVEGDIFTLTDLFNDELVGVVGGKILNYSGGRELSCGKTYNWFNVFLLALGVEEMLGVRFAPSKEQDVDHVSGAFFAIRRLLFEKLNGFDDHYFMYIEDADLCFRVKKAGSKVLFSPNATIQHKGQGSSNRTFAVVQIYKGLLYFNKKHMGVLSYGIVKFFLMLKAITLVIYGRISNNLYLTTTYEEALKAV